MTLDEFDRYLQAEVDTHPDTQDRRLSRSIHTIEKEFGTLIDWDYDYIKMLSQITYLEYVANQIEKNKKK